MVCEKLLTRMTEKSREIFGDNLTGIYLHGSAAMGCFQPEKSDLDLIFVVKDDISDGKKLEFLKNVIKWNEEAPGKGIELSIVKEDVCRPFVYPTPFLFHFSRMHLRRCKEDPQGYVEEMRGEDHDLAAHFTVIRKRGIPLYGKPAEDVFGKVPREDYLDSILRDMENAGEDIGTDPVYVILNLCRVMACLKCGASRETADFAGREKNEKRGEQGASAGKDESGEEPPVLSKKEGGEWGLENLPEGLRGPVREALRCYGTGEEMKVDPGEAEKFVNYIINEIKRYSVHAKKGSRNEMKTE